MFLGDDSDHPRCTTMINKSIIVNITNHTYSGSTLEEQVRTLEELDIYNA
jgi:hypothetical protein